MSDPQSANPGGGNPLDYAPRHPVQRDYSSPGPTQYCAYCSAPLDPFLYFCRRCATPYKQIEMVTGTPRPAPLTDGQRIKRMAPHTWTVFWTYAWVLVGCLLLSLLWPEKSGGTPPVLEFFATLAIFVTTVVFACIHWRPLAAQLKTSGFLKWESWAGLGMLVPLLLVNLGIHVAARKWLPDRTNDLGDGMPIAVGVLVFCLFPAITEEIAFRGLIQYWLEVSLTPMKALLLGSAMFAGLHLAPLSFPYLFTVGATLAIVRRRTGSLYPGMLIHFLHNLVVITVFPLF